MVELSPHDAAALSRLVRFALLPADKRQKIFEDILADDARMVGEIILDRQKYEEAPPKVQATVDRFLKWRDVNHRLAEQRASRRRAARARRSPAATASQL